MYAGTISVSGTLSKEVTSTTNTAPINVLDCNGAVLSTIPSEAITTTKYEPYARSGQTVRFEVTRLENPVVSIVTIDTNINNFNYNASDGQFSIDLTRNVIIESRYNYKVKIRISENSYASVIFDRDYALAPAGSGSAFPVGSVIAYLGNSSNVAGMESNGWFKCDGRAISGLGNLSNDEKTALTNILGGSTNLPDLRGNFLRGLDEGRGYDDDASFRTGGEGGTGVRSWEPNSFESHNHPGSSANAVSDHQHYINLTTSSDGWSRSTDDGGTTGTAAENSGTHNHTVQGWSDPAGGHSHSVNVATQGGAETRPENIAVYWLIRGR